MRSTPDELYDLEHGANENIEYRDGAGDEIKVGDTVELHGLTEECSVNNGLQGKVLSRHHGIQLYVDFGKKVYDDIDGDKLRKGYFDLSACKRVTAKVANTNRLLSESN